MRRKSSSELILNHSKKWRSSKQDSANWAIDNNILFFGEGMLGSPQFPTKSQGLNQFGHNRLHKECCHRNTPEVQTIHRIPRKRTTRESGGP